jgi:hypothetical protein
VRCWLRFHLGDHIRLMRLCYASAIFQSWEVLL